MSTYRAALSALRPAGVLLGALVTLAACGPAGGESDEHTGVARAEILSGSDFEGNDGNLIVDTTGDKDWVNIPGRVTGVDLQSGSTDNSFGQGTKEDDPSATVVAGSIPPNKNDLTRFYIASDFRNNENYLYLAWERAVNIGAANLDFEINQNPTTGFTGSTTGAVTLNRTAGDILITYDFSGSGTPTLGLLKWVTTGATSQCFSSGSLPCWGNRVNLSAAGFAEGQVNTATIDEPIISSTAKLTTGLFGEAAINLTAANVFPAGTCTAFGSAFVKSRSSTSFKAEIKDFIAPQPVSISNCGTITIHKVTENGDGTFGFTTTGSLTPSTFDLSNGGSQSYKAVPPGSYTVTESTPPSGWTLKSLACTSNTASSVTTSGATASITMAPGGNVDCTYTNHTNVSPTVSTQLSGTSTTIGTAVHDSATLSGATANAGGTVTYTVYTDNACSLNPVSAGTVTVTNGIVPDSDAITFANAGTFYWQAVYSGDANNNGAKSPCLSEVLVVNPNTTSIGTTQTLLPNDSATLLGATATAGGTITFDLYDPNAPTCGGAPAYTETVNVNGPGTHSTSNTTFLATTVGTWRWLVTYSGDANNTGSTSACGVESFTIAQ